MRTILFAKTDENYIQKCANELKFSYGIIIGQRVEENKYIVVHCAKNTEDDLEFVEGAKSIEEINVNALSSQWISATRMIPGSFEVLGIFVSSPSEDILEENTFKLGKKVIQELCNQLAHGTTFSGIVDRINSTDHIFFSYSTANNAGIAKLFTPSSNGGLFAPMEHRFVEKPFDWYSFECSYELDDIFPILDKGEKINIERQFQSTITAVGKSLASSVIFIQYETIADDIVVEDFAKKISGNSRKSSTDETEKNFKASIYLPIKCQLSEDTAIRVRKFSGTIRYSGLISSRVWCNPKSTFADVKRFLRDDILRSLAARVQVYCDGLTDPVINKNAIFISEPPRRVYFNLPLIGTSKNYSPVQFSEYIFRGEAPTVAVAQAKQVLDLDIDSEKIITDLEGLAEDIISFSSSEAQQTVADLPRAQPDQMRTMYMLGITVALLVFMISLYMNYLFSH